MKLHTAIRTAIMGVALATAAAIAPAQDGPGMGDHRPPMERMMGMHGAHGRWWNDPAVIDRLKLTDDQRKDMDNILLQHREKLIDLRGDVEKAELAMDPLVNADQPNEPAILAQIDKLAQARAELEKANARFLLALRAKLTPDQWKQLQAMHSERHEGMHRHEGRDHGPGSDAPGGNPPPPGGPGPQSMLQPPQPPLDQQFSPEPAEQISNLEQSPTIR